MISIQAFKNRFIDPQKRKKYRIRKKRSFLADFFLYSNAGDYRVLRFFVNLPFGVLISWLLYTFIFYRVNFLDDPELISPGFCTLFKWLQISSAAGIYAWNPVVRCTLIIATFACFGSQGLNLLFMLVIEQVNEGPVMNILRNFNVSSNIVICNLDLQANITRRRVELITGPAEEFLEKRLGNGTSLGKKVMHTLKALLQPFDEELYVENSEDDYLAAMIDSAKALADREIMVEGNDDGRESDETKFGDEHLPIWTRFHSQLGRAIARRYTQRCDEMFTRTVETCHKKFEDTQSRCYEYVPFYLAFFTCQRMNALDLCQPEKVNSIMEKYCDLGNRVEDDGILTPDLDQQMFSIQNVYQQIERQLKLNLHFIAVEQPELERAHALTELRFETEHVVSLFMDVYDTANMITSMFMVFMCYYFFKKCISQISKYLNDIGYRNRFLTRHFWYIEEKRRRQGRSILSPLTDSEKKKFELIKPLSITHLLEDERNELIKSLICLTILVIFVILHLLLDYYIYKILLLVTKHANIEGMQKGEHILQIEVNGTGPLAEIIRDILRQNYKQHIANKLITEICLVQPHPLNWHRYTLTIGVPLLVMLFFQVLLNFAVRRIILLGVLSFMFPRRARARTIALYNDILRYRAIKLKEVPEDVYYPEDEDNDE